MSVRAFSGVQPTGTLHLGNSLGALKPWVQHQDDRENIFCVVDLHAITIPEVVTAEALRDKSRSIAAVYLAAGIDPARSHIFIQSHVREHSELAWVLSCATPLGWVERMTQFKAKSARRSTVGTGLLTYPVLQAGADQKQHIELTRDIAIRFNQLFGDTFVVPDVSLPQAGARIMGLDEPTVKMSKSYMDARPHHAVAVLDTPKKIRKSLMKAVTDSGCEYDPDQASAGVLNLMGILSACSGEAVESIAARFDGQGYGYLKKEVADAVLAELEPLQAEYHRLTDDPTHLDAVLDASTDQVRSIAEATMARVRAAVGIGHRPPPR